MKKSANDRAFTLAEVLIALVIIGIIAALTVPTLMHKVEKQGYVSGLKKAYSILNNATNMIIANMAVVQVGAAHALCLKKML